MTNQITATLLTHDASSVDTTSWSTASITPSPNKLLLFSLITVSPDGIPAPTVTGCGLTWELVDQMSVSANSRCTFIYRAMGAAPTPGPVTATDPLNMTSACWSVVELDGVDTSGANGSGAIVQTNAIRRTGVSSVDMSLPNPVGADNVTFGAMGCAQSTVTQVPGSGYEQLAFDTINTPSNGLLTEWANPGLQDITCTYTGATGNPFVVGCEIQAAAPGSSTLNDTKVGSTTVASAYVGSQPVSAMYVGSTQVFP